MILILLATGALFSSAARADTSDSIWIEGENPTSINLKPTIGGWGHKEFLSGEKWLQVSIDADKVPSDLPPDGGLITYHFDTGTTGNWAVWDRIGYEFVRSPFDWRVDDGPWSRIAPTDLTTDMQEFQTWNEVAWLQLGSANLSQGSHSLQIRLPKTLDAKGNPGRVLYASDAILITSKPFHPNGKFQPGQDYRTDLDRQAASTVFKVDSSPGPQRQTVDLGGLWEIARDDEQQPGEVAKPIEKLPDDPIWYGIQVPGDKNELRPELMMAHRLWYRTRVTVPDSQIGKSFSLTFPQNNLNTTVYVNGVLCGFNKNPFVKWSCDVTKAVKAGENQVWVGIRDAWYGYSTNPKDPMKLRNEFVYPLALANSGFQDLAYPVWHAFESGILDTPSLTVSGPVTVTDVFVKPSVSRKELATEFTLENTTAEPQKVRIEVDATDDKTGSVVKALGAEDASIDPHGVATLHHTAPWADPVLWWPDQPQMYRLRTTVSMGGKALDVSETPFGFREWSVHGSHLLLNGIVWHGWADLTPGRTADEWLANYRKTGQRLMRLAGAAQNGGTEWQGMSFQKALDWMDRNGVVVRRCGPLDGEAIGYWAIENDPDLQSLYHTRIKKQLLDNWRDQMVAQVRGERNHPSIGMWSIENEWLYINCINLYGDLMDQFEGEEKATLDAVAAVDPTRPAMSDGGGSGKGNLFPVHGDHYVFTNNPSDYPELAYGPFPEGGGRGRWTWDGKRPRYMGEEFYAEGINPADYAWIQGETAFAGKVASEQGKAMVQRMLTEGYRWGGFASAWHLWIGNEGAQYGKYTANAERAVFCRQHDWTFGSDQSAKRTFGIFNDSHSKDPISLTYSLQVGGKVVLTKTASYSIVPGENSKFDVALKFPAVSHRTEGRLYLALSVKGNRIFQDVKSLSVLPPPPPGGGQKLAVFDPKNTLSHALTSDGFKVQTVTDLEKLPPNCPVLVVAPDALDPFESTQSRLAAFAADGHRVIILDQQHPLHYQGLPIDMQATGDSGSFGFEEDSESPVFAGLANSDFAGWQDGVYRQAYVKAPRGVTSLLQAGPRLGETAVAEVPVGTGLLLLSQVRTTDSAVSKTLLCNLIRFATSYRLEFRKVSVAADDDPSLSRSLEAIGLKSNRVSSSLEALKTTAGIAVVSASPQNLHLLASNLAEVRAFTQAGGSLVLHGLTPDGLADYNRLVGVDHMIRPFRREKTELVLPRERLAAGLSEGDVAMNSSEHMFDFNSDMFAASDIFSYIVDLEDVAPFAKLPNDYLYNTVNGFVSADSWKYIYSFDLTREKPEYTMEFPKEQRITELTWIGNAIYHKVTRLSLTFDGRDPETFDVQPNDSTQVLRISPARSARTIGLKILDWTHEPTSADVVGIDNISLKAERSPAYEQTVKPILNIGGLVDYRQGKGNIVLANLLFKDHEDVPENADKKLRILATILRNLKAPFTSGKTVVAGATGLTYTPVDISKKANQFRNEKGWFGDKSTTFADLPSGRHIFGGVPFDVFDFPTSPVPNSVMLGGDGIPGNLASEVDGIAVNAKADSLFFLQAARIDQRRSNDEVQKARRFELAEYVIHYSDGTTAAVPIESEIDVDDYRQEDPRPLSGAQIAWVHPLSGTKLTAVAYVQQWNNPRPEVAISSIDLRYGPEKRGVPALLAVTAAK